MRDHHHTSCQWYDWRNKAEAVPLKRSSTLPSYIFETRNQRLVGTTKIRHTSIQASCKANSRQADTSAVTAKRAVVPSGEARDYNLFAFSQHDNRHKIKLPAKKTELRDDILQQSKSANVSQTLNWDYDNPANEDGFNYFHYQRKENLPSYYRKVDDVNNSEFVVGKKEMGRYRRFPKFHNDSLDKYTTLQTENQKNCILNHDSSYSSKNENTLKDNGKNLISLQYLAQPQFYTGSSKVHARQPSTSQLKARKLKSAGDVKRPSWHYSYHPKTNSRHVMNSTKNACYRF